MNQHRVAACLCCAGAIVALASHLATAQGRQAAPAASSRDFSGFWELSVDSRHVPDANLLPTVTRAMRTARAKKDAYAIRWCNLLGMPFVMDSGRPLDIRQGRRNRVIRSIHRGPPGRRCRRSAA